MPAACLETAMARPAAARGSNHFDNDLLLWLKTCSYQRQKAGYAQRDKSADQHGHRTS